MSFFDDIGDWFSEAIGSSDLSDVVAEAVPEAVSNTNWLDALPELGDAASSYAEPVSSSWLDSLPALGDVSGSFFTQDPYSYLDSMIAEPKSYWATSIPEVSGGDVDSYLSANRINPVTNMPSYATDSSYINTPTSPGIMDTLDKYGTALSSPGGKLLMGLGGAGISALSAMKQNALMKEAAKKQAEALAAKQAIANQYSAPLRLSLSRQATAPTARSGESSFFTNNKLPSYFAKGGRTGPLQNCMCGGGAMGYVKGGSPGQADRIDAKVSDGEYVMDSDVVSALGDGNNEAGAKVLDQMRSSIRTHKRSAPANKIPPKAKSPLAYMKNKGAK